MDLARVSRRMELGRGLGSLACVASTAPLVGFLWGSVGIFVAAFTVRGGEKAYWLAEMVLGLVDGLMPMAWGLAIGILVWWVYRYLRACVDEFDADMAGAALLVLNCLAVRR